MKYTRHSRSEKDGTRTAALHVQSGEDLWLLTVTKGDGFLSVDFLGAGISPRSAEQILEDLAHFLPPDFVDRDEHQQQLKDAI